MTYSTLLLDVCVIPGIQIIFMALFEGMSWEIQPREWAKWITKCQGCILWDITYWKQQTDISKKKKTLSKKGEKENNIFSKISFM